MVPTNRRLFLYNHDVNNLKVYIDFEEISNPFRWELKFHKVLPFAYTIGMFIGQKFMTKTHVVDFKHVHLKDIYQNFKNHITRDIRTLLQNDKFAITPQTIEFAAYNGTLERRALDIIFKNFKVVDIAQGKLISLQRATEREMGQKEYFTTLRRVANQSLDKAFIKRRGLEQAGALATLAGYVLYTYAHPRPNYKHQINIDTQVLIRELRYYSRDDVCKCQ